MRAASGVAANENKRIVIVTALKAFCSFGWPPGSLWRVCLCAILAPVVVREIWIALSVSDEFKPQLDAGVAPKLRSAAEIMSIHEHKCNPIKRVL